MGSYLLSFNGLWDILDTVVSSEDAGEIICVLDALDECSEKRTIPAVKSSEQSLQG